jgi:hypothetical protein
MNIIETARNDLSFTLEDQDTGFAFEITITKPDTTTATIMGSSIDIGFFLDTNTGLGARGRMCEVNVRLQSLIDAGCSGLLDDWDDYKFTFEGKTFIIKDAPVDRTLGIVKLQAEVYDAS